MFDPSDRPEKLSMSYITRIARDSDPRLVIRSHYEPERILFVVEMNVTADFSNTASEPTLCFECGHLNNGSVIEPASYVNGCPMCGEFYCDTCNYGGHQCPACGGIYNHRDFALHMKEEIDGIP